jgi:antitoxin CcdA
MRILAAHLFRMNRLEKPVPARRATNLTLPEDLVREARERGVNLSQACEAGLRKAVTDARREAWLRDARPAMDAYNAWIAENGIPLEEYRQF